MEKAGWRWLPCLQAVRAHRGRAVLCLSLRSIVPETFALLVGKSPDAHYSGKAGSGLLSEATSLPYLKEGSKSCLQELLMMYSF